MRHRPGLHRKHRAPLRLHKPAGIGGFGLGGHRRRQVDRSETDRPVALTVHQFDGDRLVGIATTGQRNHQKLLTVHRLDRGGHRFLFQPLVRSMNTVRRPGLRPGGHPQGQVLGRGVFDLVANARGRFGTVFLVHADLRLKLHHLDHDRQDAAPLERLDRQLGAVRAFDVLVGLQHRRRGQHAVTRGNFLALDRQQILVGHFLQLKVEMGGDGDESGLRLDAHAFDVADEKSLDVLAVAPVVEKAQVVIAHHLAVQLDGESGFVLVGRHRPHVAADDHHGTQFRGNHERQGVHRRAGDVIVDRHGTVDGRFAEGDQVKSFGSNARRLAAGLKAQGPTRLTEPIGKPRPP